MYFLNNEIGWATGEVYEEGTNYVAVLKTTDGGGSWFEQAQFIDKPIGWITFTNAQQGWLVAYDDEFYKNVVYATTDGGENWTLQAEATEGDVFKGFFLDESFGWFVGYDGEIVHTSDGGVSWNPQTEHETFGVLQDLHFVNAQKGWAIGTDLLFTDDGGLNWTRLDDDPLEYWEAVHFADNQNGGVLSNYNYASNDQYVLYTNNGGVDWVEKVIPTAEKLGDIFFADAMNAWAVGRSGTIFHTEDGGESWIEQETDIEHYELNAVFFIDAETGWVVGGGDAVLKTTDGGDHWVPVEFGTPYDEFRTVFFLDEMHGYIVQDYSKTLWITTDGGNYWEEHHIEATYQLYDVFFTSPEEGWVTEGAGDIWYTSDGGESWTKQETVSGFGGAAICFTDNQNGWSVAYNSGIFKYSGDASGTEEQGGLTAIDVRIFPNPTNGPLNIIFPDEKPYSIQVLDLSGQVRHTYQHQGQSRRLSLHDLNTGIYLIRVYNEHGSYSRKIMVAK